MTPTKFMLAAAAAVALSGTLASCGDDNKNDEPLPTPTAGPTPAPARIFTAGIPKSVGEYDIVTANGGLVSEIIDRKDGETASFNYSVANRAATYNATMTVTDNTDPSDRDVYYLTLNEQGYIASAVEVDSDGDRQKWTFTYNADGQLETVLKRNGRTTKWTITYNSGDITAVNANGYVSEVNYNFEGSTIPNTGAIMLWDETFDIDLDDLELAYYAGMLGTPTRNLPAARSGATPSDRETFTWTVGTSGLPSRLEVYETYGYPELEEVINFVW